MRRISIAVRLAMLMAIGLLVSVFVSAESFFLFDRIERATLERMEIALAESHKAKLRAATHSVAVALGEGLKRLSQESERIACVRAGVDPIRFESDQSGYYFIYDGTTNVALPTKKELQGQDLGDVKDKNGVPYVRELARAAQGGGGFVSYVFPKPGQGDQPKLAYAEMIPGTTMWIGTGVYIDNVEAEKGAIAAALRAHLADSLRAASWQLALVLAAAAGLAYVVFHSVAAPLRATAAAARRIAEGDLAVVLPVDGRDEAADLNRSLATMIDALQVRITEAQERDAQAAQETERARQALAEAAEAKRQAEQARREGMLQAASALEGVSQRLASSCRELTAQVEQSSQGAENQKERLTETSTAMTEMSATVSEVARCAAQAAADAELARKRALSGADVAQESVQAIGRVQRDALALKENMSSLSGRAEDIGKIMNVISDIADQTNLLALNAAIEAARAGDAGRGFAVVADEVRKLAEKTVTATKEVGEAIAAIQAGARLSAQSVDSAVASVQEATRMVADSGQELNRISALAEKTSDQVRTIAAASEQQSATTEEINRAVDQISGVSHETSQAMAHASRAMTELSAQTREIVGLIERMRAG